MPRWGPSRIFFLAVVARIFRQTALLLLACHLIQLLRECYKLLLDEIRVVIGVVLGVLDLVVLF